jgi:hypothetical protein
MGRVAAFMLTAGLTFIVELAGVRVLEATVPSGITRSVTVEAKASVTTFLIVAVSAAVCAFACALCACVKKIRPNRQTVVQASNRECNLQRLTVLVRNFKVASLPE